ncbi:MAG: DJ-1/PfpI family protein [Treponema sp.]|nr:DJ-1/PfpI family protein [Treponema sp.]
MSKIAIFLAPGFEEIEALTCVDYLRRANQNVVTVSVPGVDSSEITSVVTGSHGVSVITDQILKDFADDSEDSLPDAIYFPGGMPGASNLAACDYLIDLIQIMEESGKIVAAMCASPAVVLSKSGILAGRKWTCYPKMNENLSTYCGSAEKALELTKDSSVVENVPFVFDKNVLTGRGPGTAEQFAMEFVRILTDEATAKKIHDGSCQR